MQIQMGENVDKGLETGKGSVCPKGGRSVRSKRKEMEMERMAAIAQPLPTFNSGHDFSDSLSLPSVCVCVFVSEHTIA